jgi:peptidoglycan/LPS O-acetylase OafA/YrhL
LYLVFPILLLVLRKAGAIVVLATTTATVATIGVLAAHSSIVDMLMRLTPQFAVLFAFGMVATGVLRTGVRGAHTVGARSVPWPWLALVAAVPVILVIAMRGSVWTVEHYFWIDVALGPAIALMLAGVATGRPRPLVRVLDTRPLRSLGSFSYSLYLTHAPLVVIVYEKVVVPHFAPGLPSFLITLALSAPLTIVVARLFAAVVEIPFQRNRDWTSLRAAMRARWSRWTHTPISPPVADPAAVPDPAVSDAPRPSGAAFGFDAPAPAVGVADTT